jgi:hypothetical protein
LNYLEFYEKYFILYNSVHANDYKTAAQYLWLFQKLNASSISSSANELTNTVEATTSTAAASAASKQTGAEGGENSMENDLSLFKFLTKTSSLSDVEKLHKLRHEQKMHSRLIITIYLANS